MDHLRKKFVLVDLMPSFWVYSHSYNNSPSATLRSLSSVFPRDQYSPAKLHHLLLSSLATLTCSMWSSSLVTGPVLWTYRPDRISPLPCCHRHPLSCTVPIPLGSSIQLALLECTQNMNNFSWFCAERICWSELFSPVVTLPNLSVSLTRSTVSSHAASL